MDPIRKIEEMVEPALEGMGYELVRVRMSGTARPTLQIMADRADGAGMTVDDCAEISHVVSALLDVEDPIHGAYSLEVSSPGIDRPLTRPKDFKRYEGFEAKIELRHAADGQRRFRGRIESFENGLLRLAMKDGEMAVPFEDIQHARLVLNDELLAAAAGQTVEADG